MLVAWRWSERTCITQARRLIQQETGRKAEAEVVGVSMSVGWRDSNLVTPDATFGDCSNLQAVRNSKLLRPFFFSKLL